MQQFLNESLEVFLAMVLDEIKNTDPSAFPEPTAKPPIGEKPIGILPNDARKAYIVYKKAQEKLSEQCADFLNRLKSVRSTRSTNMTQMRKAIDDMLSLTQQHSLVHKRYNIVETLFEQAVVEAFPQLAPQKCKFLVCREYELFAFEKDITIGGLGPLSAILMEAFNRG